MSAPRPRLAATPRARSTQPELVRGLGVWDGVLLTISGIVGTGIFLTTADIARVLPHGGMILLVWIVGGALTLAGALSYAELGAMFPRAGGMYHFLKEAYGPLWGFFYGWASFWVIMTGGIAAIAVGTGEYLGAFFPYFSTRHILLTAPLGGYSWTLSGGQLAAAIFIAVLTAINVVGLRQGAMVQNALTVAKVGAIGAFLVFGFLVPAKASPQLAGALPPGNLLSAFGVGMIAALWTFDGWYGLTFSAGEMRNPGRNLPLGLVGGTAAVTAIYLLLNWVYLRALPAAEMGEHPRIAEAAAQTLFGERGAQLLTAAVLVSSLGCLAATILYAARIYLPMAQDGLFFRGLAEVDPRHRTPARCLIWQGMWSVLLTLSGKYDQLYTYVIFIATLMHVATGLAVFVLRRKRPDAPRPYRVWGYPVVPALFVLASAVLVANTLRERPVESLGGLGILALGLPAYVYWRRRAGAAP
jgi:APA family basic amino acid/polyamine antiporter